MKPNQKHKLQAIAKKIKSRGEKIPQDIDLLLKYIDKKTDELKKT
jgi:hypothetical protein